MIPLEPKKIRTSTLKTFKENGTKFSCLTSYDKLTAEIFDEAGIEVLLVGDSAGDNVLGHSSTLAITLDEMIIFGKAVSAATKRALVVIDMPFGSYEAGPELALANAVSIMKRSDAQAIKLEGGSERVPQVLALVSAGIPVMGHLGFTPQSVHALGGFKVQGRGESAEKLIADSLALESAGVFAIVLEMVPAELAEEISKSLKIPTIGIGAGNQTDGQILVWQDFAGLGTKAAKFVKKYLNLRNDLLAAAGEYRAEVRKGEFPTSEQSF